MTILTKSAYLEELESNLLTLPIEERKLAIEFYSEYFDDAGGQNESAVIEELGTPFKLAKSIISEQSEFSKSLKYMEYKQSRPIVQDEPVYTSLRKEDYQNTSSPNSFEPDIMPSGYYSQQPSPPPSPMQPQQPVIDNTPDIMPPNYYKHQQSQQNRQNQQQADYNPRPTQTSPYSNPSPYQNANQGRDYKPKKKRGILFWIIVIALSPIIIPFVTAAASIVFTAAVTLAALLISGWFAVAGGGIAIIVGVISFFFASTWDGLEILGAGFISLGIGLILLIPNVIFFKKTLPWIKNKRKFSNKRGGVN